MGLSRETNLRNNKGNLMNSFEEIKTLLKEKSGKKLTALSVGIFLLITVIELFGAYEFCRNIHLDQMYQYLEAVPNIIESRKNEMLMRSRVYEDDILSRAELGLKVYSEENELTDAEKLEQVRDTVGATSVSLLEGQSKLLSTTGPVSPEENFHACIQDLEPRVSHLELYTVPSEDGDAPEKSDGKGFILIPVPGNTDRSLVFEFSCDTMLEIYDNLSDWSDELEYIISDGEAGAFAKTDDRLAVYQKDDVPPEQTMQLHKELTNVFEKSDEFRSRWNGNPGKLITLLGDRFLAALMQFPEQNTDIMLTDPLMNVIRTGFFLAGSISAIIGWGIILLQLYVFRRLHREKDGKETTEASCKSMLRAMWPGLLVMVVATLIFSGMLLLLEKRTNTTFIAKSQRENVQYEIDWRKTQQGTIRNTFEEIYRTRAQMLAKFLTKHPDQQTNAGLRELSRIAGTDYLMRFDSAGQELAASNSYTGFSVGDNLSEEYRAVLLGYPYAVVGPAADPYTGRMQLGTAVLMTDEEEQPDGFLLAVYSVEDLNKELKRMSYENTVSSYAVQKGQIAAAISDKDGSFIAHTDPGMIGQKASDVLPYVQPGSSFEGFTTYNGEKVYISASTSDGKTLLFVVPEQGSASLQANTGLAALAVWLLVLIYYPNAAVLISQAMTEAKEKLNSPADAGSPMKVFSDGYATFLTLFSIFALIASANGWWESFGYLYSRQWSKGVNLFSIWTAVIIVTVTLFFELLIRTTLRLLENRMTPQAKTITRLISSLITYALCIFLFFYILDMFGVNTTALLASAGVISIAVGMGAKSMAEDLLAGFFMMMEGTIQVGDYVKVTGGGKGPLATGTVTDMGIRTTEITDDDGSVLVLNNSKVTGVINMSRKQKQEDDPENKS